MSGYIMVWKDLLTEMKFRRVVRAYIASRGRHAGDAAELRYETAVTHVLGALTQLWIYADTHIRDDNTIQVSTDEIDELVGIAGFCKLLPADWLEILEPDCIQLTDFLQHNGTVAKKKVNHANRQARYRERQKSAANDATASPADKPRDAEASPSHPIPSHPIPSHPIPTQPTAERAHRADVSHGTSEPEIFEAVMTLKAKYPKGSAREDWITAEKRMRELVLSGESSWVAIQEGVERYAHLCRATNRTVMNPANFFGAVDKPWSQEWPLPVSRAESRLTSNVDAALEAKKRIFGGAV